MCGRYALTAGADVLAALFQITPELMAPAVAVWTPRYNLAPTETAPALRRRKEGGLYLDALRWGLVPFWAKDLTAGARAINARSETVGTRPTFREAVRTRRALVPADGFYEWRKERGVKQPYFVRRVDGAPMVFAGLWERWRSEDGDAVRTFTILTTTPNAMLADLHDRMPVILEPEQFEAWMDAGVEDPASLAPMLRPCPDGVLELRPVSRRVNSVRNDDAGCLAPPEPVAPDAGDGDGQLPLFGG